jgi:hypothetical protein
VTFAVFQTMLTALFAARPEPAIVNGVPAFPMSGAVFSTAMFAACFAGGAIGPGSGATPGMAGGVSGVGVATAGADRSSAPASTEPTSVSFCVIVVLILSLAFDCSGGLSSYGMIVMG